ncbi:hypothetical protein SFMTTN_1100 [Sulfuriferula multivorans]|uniref:Uncharacterized protein n=1 Tax=Sulfuriferula multivorans TaxID=1559896 RepID=A0A401JCB6_9PROT|nr:hypothetical protein SFMTTN_1100 [Sulfuriferula multivorans]
MVWGSINFFSVLIFVSRKIQKTVAVAERICRLKFRIVKYKFAV